MCDRIVVLASNPGHIAAELPVPLEQPRDRLKGSFREIVDQIYAILTSRSLEAINAQRQEHGIGPQPLPAVSVNQINGLLERVVGKPYLGHADLANIAAGLSLRIHELFPTAEALHLLEFAEIQGTTLRLTAAGHAYAKARTAARKRLLREHLLRFVPLAAHIAHVLEERREHQAPRLRFEAELEDHLTHREAERTLRVVTGWARYAELFTYDDKSRHFAA